MKKTRTFLSLLLAVLMLVGVFGGVYADSYTLIGVKLDSGGIEYSSTFHGFVYDSNSFNFVWKGDKSPDEGCAPLTSGVYNDKGLNETCTDTDIATKDTFYIGIGITRMNGAPINVAPEAKNIQFTMTGYTADYVGVEEKKNDEYSAIYMVFKIKSTLPRYTINGLSVTGSGFTYSDEEQAYVMNDPKFSFNWKDKKAPKSYTTCVTAVYCSDDLWRTTSKEDFETAPFYIGIGLAQDNSYTLTTDSGVEKSFNLTIPGYVAKYSRMIHKDGYIYLMFQVNKIDDKVYTATGVTVKANGIKYFEDSEAYDVDITDYEFTWKNDPAPSEHYCPVEFSVHCDQKLLHWTGKEEFSDSYIYYFAMGITPMNPEICNITTPEVDKSKCVFELPGYNTEFVKMECINGIYAFIFKFYKDGAVDFPFPTEAVPPTATPTTAPSDDGPSENNEGTNTDPKSQILAFVERIYTYVLDREPEADGAKFWSDELYAFRRTGAEVAQGFIFSPEFENRKTSDRDFVTILYKTFFGREPDDEGMNYWLSQLSSGAMDRMTVANGFIYSQEWANTCASYGIRSGGDLKPTGKIAPTDLTYSFVERMYTTAMGRGYDEEGKQYWASELANFNITGEQCGASFFLSAEMESYQLSNKDFLGRLYATFMNRDADSDGEAYWLGVLASGTSRADVVFGFTRSPEFTDKCVEARILPF